METITMVIELDVYPDDLDEIKDSIEDWYTHHEHPMDGIRIDLKGGD